MDLRAMFLFLMSAPALAGTFVVDDDRADCPNADFAAIQLAVGAAEPGDKILVCPGVYLGTVEVTKSDLRIEAQGVLGDVILQGAAGQEWGFHLLRTSGVVLHGFWVQDFVHANIFIEQGSGNTLRHNVTRRGVIDGIRVEASTGNTIEHNVSFENSGPAGNNDGIFVLQSTHNVIRHNEMFRNVQFGINLSTGSSDNVVSGNRVYDNGCRGINNGLGAINNVIEENTVSGSALGVAPRCTQGVGNGILVVNAALVTVRNNLVEKNASSGIVLNNSSDVIVANNRSEANLGVGITLNNGSRLNHIEKNHVLDNSQDGIRLVNADGNFLRQNYVRRSGRDGINADAASTLNTIEHNWIHESGGRDATDLDANTWIDNKCETESRPGLCER
jgi:parallel beta-helix repeat protein